MCYVDDHACLPDVVGNSACLPYILEAIGRQEGLMQLKFLTKIFNNFFIL